MDPPPPRHTPGDALDRLENPGAWHVMPSRGARRREREAAARRHVPAATRVQQLLNGAGQVPGLGTRTVVDEDTFERSLASIIQRQYFPDLPRLEQQLEWVEALESGDSARIRRASRRVDPRYRRSDAVATPTPDLRPTGSATPSAAPAARCLEDLGEAAGLLDAAPGEVDSLEAEPDAAAGAERSAVRPGARAGRARAGKRPRPPSPSSRAAASAADPAMTVSRFLAEFETEDAASFRGTEHRRAAQRREELWWVYQRPDTPGRLRAIMPAAERGALDALEDDLARAALLRASGRGRVDGLHHRHPSPAHADTHDDDDRPAAAAPGTALLGAASTHRPRNQLFFPPELAVSNDVSRVRPADVLPSRELLPALAIATGSAEAAVAAARAGSMPQGLFLEDETRNDAPRQQLQDRGEVTAALLGNDARSGLPASEARSPGNGGDGPGRPERAPRTAPEPAPAEGPSLSGSRAASSLVRMRAGGADGLPAASQLVRWVQPAFTVGPGGALLPPRVLQRSATRLDPASDAARMLRDPVQAALAALGPAVPAHEEELDVGEGEGGRPRGPRPAPAVPAGVIPRAADLEAAAGIARDGPDDAGRRRPGRSFLPVSTPLPFAVVGGSGVPTASSEALGPGLLALSSAPLSAMVLPIDPPMTWGVLASDPVLLGDDGRPALGDEATLVDTMRAVAGGDGSDAESDAASLGRSRSASVASAGDSPAFAAGAPAGAPRRSRGRPPARLEPTLRAAALVPTARPAEPRAGDPTVVDGVSAATRRRTAELQREIAALRMVAAEATAYRVPGRGRGDAAVRERLRERARDDGRRRDAAEAALRRRVRAMAAVPSSGAAAGSRASFAASLRASYSAPQPRKPRKR